MSDSYFRGEIERYSGVVLDAIEPAVRRRLLRRAIQRRVVDLELKDRGAYEAYLKKTKNPEREQRALFHGLEIYRTRFFRGKKQFEFFEKEIIPALIAEKPRRTKRTLKIWSAGCATGAEPYSVALLLAHRQTKFEITATDANVRLLDIAQMGLFLRSKVDRHVPHALRGHSFEPVAGHRAWLRVTSDLQRNVRFSPCNLLRDQYPRGADVIFCRNVFYYFSPALIKNVLKKMWNAAADGGFLIATHCSDTDAAAAGWTPVAKGIYRK